MPTIDWLTETLVLKNVNVVQKEMRPVALIECFVDLSLPLKDEISKKNLRFPFVKSLALVLQPIQSKFLPMLSNMGLIT